MRRAPWLLIGAPLVVAVACLETESYVFTARRYNPEGGCLEGYAGVDLISGASVSSKCAPMCFRLDNAIYTTRVCPPLPAAAVALDPESPECIIANSPELDDSGCQIEAQQEEEEEEDGGEEDGGEEEELDGATLDAPTEDG